MPAWIKYDLGSGNEAVVNEYSLRIRNAYETQAPRSWTFEGSNDANNWTVLDTRANETSWVPSEKRNYTGFNNITTYRYYRINITANNGYSRNYRSIAEIELFTGNNSYEVYCDMTTDGGGWTFLGRGNSDKGVTDFFVTPTGTYKTSRIDDGTNYSLGKLDEWSDTEMYVTLDTAGITTADTNNKLVFYRYTDSSLFFNTGAVPCGGFEPFEYKLSSGDAYISGGQSSRCNSNAWYTENTAGQHLVLLYSSGSYAIYWGSGMGGE